jgi:dynein heavy chain
MRGRLHNCANGVCNSLQLLSKLRKYTKDPNFSADKMVQYSVACQSFCQWVLAIDRYCQVYRVVQPKRELHWKISAELEAVVGRLQAKELQLNEVSGIIAP